jgi:hypothetical protein
MIISGAKNPEVWVEGNGMSDKARYGIIGIIYSRIEKKNCFLNFSGVMVC